MWSAAAADEGALKPMEEERKKSMYRGPNLEVPNVRRMAEMGNRFECVIVWGRWGRREEVPLRLTDRRHAESRHLLSKARE